MKTVVRRYSKQQLHVVLDNSSTHGTPDVKAWLAANPRVHFHYTPTSASWLNQVEGFFGILGKQSRRLRLPIEACPARPPQPSRRGERFWRHCGDGPNRPWHGSNFPFSLGNFGDPNGN
ncbi:MAG: transposase [Polyangiaceae bacterium]